MKGASKRETGKITNAHDLKNGETRKRRTKSNNGLADAEEGIARLMERMSISPPPVVKRKYGARHVRNDS